MFKTEHLHSSVLQCITVIIIDLAMYHLFTKMLPLKNVVNTATSTE